LEQETITKINNY